MEDIKISSNEKFACIRIKDEIIIHSVELEIPIASLNINNGMIVFLKLIIQTLLIFILN